jgi:serine dehydrogenase proteinase
MSYEKRISLIEDIERQRDSHVICYLTSVRPNLGAHMSDDAVRIFFDHLLALPEKPAKKIDIFLCSNGGNGVVPWRLISLLREYAEKIGVLIPYRAYSAATMLALGADEIVMHPFAEMGPIDPTVSNAFNPVNPATQQSIGISVEDVKAYIGFIKESVGIRHEDELIKAVEILANKIHPLALGNVERFISQSRMIARKILRTHMGEESSHVIEDTIETLASKLYFHGHPINRHEARTELGLKVLEKPTLALEAAMWKLYLDFEEELKNNIVFNPMGEIYRIAPVPAPAAPGQPPTPPIVPVGTNFTSENVLAIVECSKRSSRNVVQQRFVVAATGGQAEPIVRSEVLKQEWTHQSAPKPVPAAQKKKKARRGVP